MVSVTATQIGSCGVNTAGATREPPAWLGSSSFVDKNNWHLARGAVVCQLLLVNYAKAVSTQNKKEIQIERDVEKDKGFS